MSDQQNRFLESLGRVNRVTINGVVFEKYDTTENLLLCALMQVYNSRHLKDLEQQLMVEYVVEQATGKKFDEVQKLWQESFEEERDG